MRRPGALEPCDRVGERPLRASDRHRALQVPRHHPLPHHEAGREVPRLGDLRREEELSVLLQERDGLLVGAEELRQDERGALDLPLFHEALERAPVHRTEPLEEITLQADGAPRRGAKG